MAIDGTGSTFPTSLDDWGNAKENNVCEVVDSTFFNRMEHATFALENHTLRIMRTGEAGVITHSTSGADRPKVLFKTYTVVLTGSSTNTKSIPLSGFTATEKALFNGTPLASGNNVHVQIRRTEGRSSPHSVRDKSFHCGISNPITDTSGDTGWTLVASTIRHGAGDENIGPGLYTISVMITG